jgi:hypothetical protein
MKEGLGRIELGFSKYGIRNRIRLRRDIERIR